MDLTSVPKLSIVDLLSNQVIAHVAAFLQESELRRLDDSPPAGMYPAAELQTPDYNASRLGWGKHLGYSSTLSCPLQDSPASKLEIFVDSEQKAMIRFRLCLPLT
jgi:hypothetical protein